MASKNILLEGISTQILHGDFLRVGELLGSNDQDGRHAYMVKTSTYHNMGLDARKPVFRGLGNNTDADQPAHPCSLISAFVIHFLERIIYKLATGEITIF